MAQSDKNLLEHPKFGIPPERQNLYKKTERFEFEDLLDIVREHPREWAQIAEFKGSNRALVAVQARTCRARIWRFLLLRHPLDEWKVGIYVTPDTWADREMWVMFVGEMTPEEALKLDDMRKEAYSKDRHQHLEKSARHQARLNARRLLRERDNQRGITLLR